jgi:hypothetical protein
MNRTLAQELIFEYISNEDRDGNGKVYKYDFDFYPENKPLVLAMLRLCGVIIQPSTYKMITWDSYVDWKNHGGTDPLI